MKIGAKALFGVVASVCVVGFASGCAAPTLDEDEELASTTANIGENNAPAMVYPSAGQTLGLSGSYMFKVKATRGSKGTLCSLWQNGKAIWENYANDKVLGQNGECAIHPDHPLHKQFKSGAAHFMARDLVNGKWTDAREIDIKLKALRPTMAYPAANQVIGLGQSYMFKMNDAKGTEGALCSIWQDGIAIWENYANDKTLGQNGECALHPNNARHGYVHEGSAKFMGRYLVHGEWSDAVEIPLTIR